MKNKFLKIVVIGVTTITLLFTFISVNADAPNVPYMTNIYNVGNWVPSKSLDDIELPRDFDGMYLALNNNVDQELWNFLYSSTIDNSYSYVRIIFPIYEDLVISPSISFQHDSNNNDLLIFDNYISRKVVNGFEIGCDEYGRFIFKSLYGGAWRQLFTIDKTTNFSVFDGDWYVYDILSETYANSTFIKFISFPLRENKAFVNYQFETNLSSFGNYGNSFEILRKYFQTSYIQLMPSEYLQFLNNYYLSEIEIARIEGYNAGYEAGVVSDGSYRFTFLTGIFNGISDLLSIEIFPNVQLGYFIFVPLALGITGLIFWFWRKD